MNKNDTHNVSLGTLYDFNKQMMLKQGKLSKSKLKAIEPKLEDWFNWQIDGYAMLLCRERYDFTVFHLYENQNLNTYDSLLLYFLTYIVTYHPDECNGVCKN